MNEVEQFLEVEQTTPERPVASAVAFILYVVGVGLLACLVPLVVAVWRWGL